MSSLKQFIRNVRAAKTIADERAVIQKESAAIRASFREESHNSNTRRKNVAKLLYLFTLGERTHFGQIECVKLLASPKFADKRLGYLGTMLLLDENQEVLTLVTNSLKNDLKNPNQNVVGLALVTLGNIASVDMSRDLFPEVEELLTTSNTYTRRKAALCAMRVCRKVPDLREGFLEKTKDLLVNRNHGILLCGLTLATSLCEIEDDEDEEQVDDQDAQKAIETFRPMIPHLVKLLNALTTSTYVPEYDVSGIADPFLQAKILKLLKVLGRGDRDSSEKMMDILAKITTTTDHSKNVGTAVLYEAVLTILEIEVDSSLRVLGVNILGKFLSVRDNNIRYVALNTLTKVVAIETNAVQRHRNTILECLRDPDISIRRRALDLAFTLINDANVRVLIRELLSFLEVADPEFKSTMTTQIGIAADRYAPTKRWHIDTMLRVLKVAGKHVKEQILASFVRLIATSSSDLQLYCVKKLYADLQEDITQDGLTIVSTWAIGEYAELLISNEQFEDEQLATGIQESDVVDLLVTILNSSYSGRVITEYIITSAMKMTTRFKNQDQINRVQGLLASHRTDLDMEIQQRAVEYSALFSHNDVRLGAFERMPAPEIRDDQRVLGKNQKKRATPPKRQQQQPAQAPARAAEDVLLDLMDDMPPSRSLAQSGPIDGAPSGMDDLTDLLSGLSTTSAIAASRTPHPAPSTNASNMSAIMDLLGSSNNPSLPAVSTTTRTGANIESQFTGPSHSAYVKNGLSIQIKVQRDPSSNGPVHLLALFSNSSPSQSRLSGVTLQVAVPKSQTLHLNPISKSVLGPGEKATQKFTVSDASGGAPAKLRLRLKVIYELDESNITEMINWAEPA